MNTRFTKRDPKLNETTVEALKNWINGDGVITVCKPTKRPKRGYTISKIKTARG